MKDYYVETINLRHGKLENKNHLFDVFAKFCVYKDSTYVWLDMLNFVAENTAWYEWDANVLLKIHSMNLARWVATMTDCLNRGDKLAIYAMCDMLKWHVFVFTRTKPWNTVDSSIVTLTIPKLCIMCDVHLIYLGNNKYSEIKCKPEVLSPLPGLIPFKRELPSLQQQIQQPLLSLTQELVVGILDDSQTICTLVSLPNLPQTIQIEAAKKDFSMKDSGEPCNENEETWPVEMVASTSKEDHDNKLPVETPNYITSGANISAPTVSEVDLEATNQLHNMEDEPVSEMPKAVEPGAANNQIEYDTSDAAKRKPPEDVNQILETEHEPVNDKPNLIETRPESQAEDNAMIANSPLVLPPPRPSTPPPQLPRNKPTPEQQDSPHTLNRVWWTEANIVKHVHVHWEIAPKASITPVEIVETVETVHFARSCAKLKPTRTHRVPRSVNNDIDYMGLEEPSDGDQSPTPKQKQFNRPRREPSSSQIKSDSFSTKLPSVRPLHRSTRLSISPDTSPTKSAAKPVWWNLYLYH